MKTSELWQSYQGYTRDLTEHSRKLGFAGAGICWFFKTPQVTFPPLIYWALIFFVGYFIADVLQSLCGALLTRWFTQNKEFELLHRTNSIEGDVDRPRWLDWPAFSLFLTKSGFLLVGFVFIVFELAWRLGDLHSVKATL